MSFFEKTSFSTKPINPPPIKSTRQEEFSPAPSSIRRSPDHSVFEGKPWITKNKLMNDLGKRYRGQVRHEIKSTDPKKIKNAVEDLQTIVQQGQHGNIITPYGAKKIIHHAHHQETLHTKEKARGGFTDSELKEIKNERGLIAFLARRFGLKRK